MASRPSYHWEYNQRRRRQGANQKSQALSLSSAVLAGNLRAHLSNQLRARLTCGWSRNDSVARLDSQITLRGSMMTEYSQNDANELAAGRAQVTKSDAKYVGIKPLVVWYGLWTGFWAIVIVMSPFDGAGFGGSLLGAAIAVPLGMYTRYLYRGGKIRVWFVLF
jgi:hypothetical protein